MSAISHPQKRMPALGAGGRTFLLTVPAIVVLAVLFAAPVLGLFSLSFGNWATGPYARLLSESVYSVIIGRTFSIAVIVTVACLVIGYPVAYFLATTSRLWRAVGFMAVMIPLWTSIVVRNYAWMVMLGRNGIVNRTLQSTGLTDQPLTLLSTQLAVVIGMVHVMVPFMILPIYSSMGRVDRDLIFAARGLGASVLRIFLHVYLPLTLRGILAGTTLVFVLSLGFFITPAMLGGGKVIMIAMVIEEQVRTFLAWEFAGALALVLLVITLLAVGFFNGIIGKFIKT